MLLLHPLQVWFELLTLVNIITLSSDLANQIVELAGKNTFNYMLLEASGVSEPSQIAPLFDVLDDHDHGQHEGVVVHLGEVARLDTCVTVIDAAEFYNNLASMEQFENDDAEGTIAQLMMEQVEFSFVTSSFIRSFKNSIMMERVKFFM